MARARLLPDVSSEKPRRPLVGYVMVTSAASLFALSGTVAKVILESGVSSLRLTEVRSTGALLGFGALLAIFGRERLRVDRRELPFLVVFGVCAVAFVQLFYFLAIHRLQIGVALLIQYLAPLLVALWARFVGGEAVRRRIWLALVLALAGLSLVVDLWGGISLDELGVVFALVAAGTYALYLLLAEHALGSRDPISLLCYGFLFSALLWALVQPWWTFPGALVARDVSLLGRLAEWHLPVWALMAWVVVLGTMAPFALVVGALRHLSATRVAIVAMLEPVAGALVAYGWLGETLGTTQLAGGAIVLGAIFLAQTAR